MKHLDIRTLIALLTLSAMLPSCQDYIPFDTQEALEVDFRKNFEDEYGTIAKDQSWDLSKSMTRIAKLPAMSDMFEEETEVTRALNDYYTDVEKTSAQFTNTVSHFTGTAEDPYSNWYPVQSSTINWISAYLPEGTNNTTKADPFTLTCPADDFAIIPIYQGKANMNWDLHIVDVKNKLDYNIWSQSQGLIVRKSEDESWKAVGNTYDDSYTIGYQYIKGQPIIINPKGGATQMTEGEPLLLYLDITQGQMKSYPHNETSYSRSNDYDYAYYGTKQRSDEGMMVPLNCPVPSDLAKTFTSQNMNLIMFIGCEDADQSDSDWDFNDVIFAVVGYPAFPNIRKYVGKRYLCEDLGNTYDFDFNDIVVDVNQSSVWQPKMAADENNNQAIEFDSEGKIVYEENTSKRVQKATLKHVCGTLPFQVTVGNTSFPLVNDPTDMDRTYKDLGVEGPTRGVNWDPEVTIDVTGWDNAKNNITLYVKTTTLTSGSANIIDSEDDLASWAKDGDGNVYTIGFPGKGQTPLIIAVDQSVNWTKEHEHIPASWWEDGSVFDPGTNGYNSDLNNGSGAGESSGGNGSKLTWDYSTATYNLDENNAAIIWSGSNTIGGNSYLEFSELYGLSDDQKKLFKALNAGLTTITFYFDGNFNDEAEYDLRNGNWGIIINKIHFSGNTLTLSLLDSQVEEILNNNSGMRLEFWNINNNFDIHLTKVTASEGVVAGEKCTLTLESNDTSLGTVTPSGTKEYAKGMTITISARANSGAHFVKWSDGSTVPYRTITIEGDKKTLTAYFEAGEISSLTWTPTSAISISNNWSASNEVDKEFSSELNAFMQTCTTDIKITITAGEITDHGDGSYHIWANGWDNELYDAARFDGNVSTFTIPYSKAVHLIDQPFCIQSGMAFTIESIKVEPQ